MITHFNLDSYNNLIWNKKTVDSSQFPTVLKFPLTEIGFKTTTSAGSFMSRNLEPQIILSIKVRSKAKLL